jgi:hypothetical protein
MRHSWVLAVLLCCGAALRADEKEALALADVGITLIGSGKVEKGKEQLFKALAHDPNCAPALFELGKLFEAEGLTASAADFLSRASVEFSKGEKSNPSYSGKRADANRRLQRLNPYAGQFAGIMEEYAADLGRIAKKSPDSLTASEALRRVEVLSLGDIVAADKLPHIEKPRSAEPEQRTKLVKTETGWEMQTKQTKNELAPDAERALKAAGWTTITGSWKKLDGNKYEVTDGKLEAAKLNGAIQLFVHKGATGTVKALVRAAKREHGAFDDVIDFKWAADGHGVVLKGTNARIYGPTQWAGKTVAGLSHEVNVPDASPKHQIVITVMEKKVEVGLNGKREKQGDGVPKEGIFLIQVDGTATIEAPQAGGQ